MPTPLAPLVPYTGPQILAGQVIIGIAPHAVNFRVANGVSDMALDGSGLAAANTVSVVALYEGNDADGNYLCDLYPALTSAQPQIVDLVGLIAAMPSGATQTAAQAKLAATIDGISWLTQLIASQSGLCAAPN